MVKISRMENLLNILLLDFFNKYLIIAYLLSVIAGATMGLLIFIPQAARYILGTDIATSGTLVVPLALTTVFVTPLSGMLLDKIGSRLVVTLGSGIAAIGTGLFWFWVNTLFSFITATVILGVGFGAIIGSPIRYIIINETGESDRALAISASSVFQQGGLLIGTSVVGGILSAQAILLSNQYNTDEANLPLSIVKPFMQTAVQQAFGVIAVSLVVSGVLALIFLKSRLREKMTETKEEPPVQAEVISTK